MNLKPYPKYKDSGIQWIGEIPEDWEVRKLKFNCQVNPTGKKYVLNEKIKVTFLPMEAVTTDGDYDRYSETEYHEVAEGYTYFTNNDVLLAKITPCFENGKGALVDKLKNSIGFGSTEFHILRSNSSTIPKYVYYFTKTHLFRNVGEAFMEGAAGQKRIGTYFTRNFPMFTPSIKEQDNIVKFLDAKTSEIDKTIQKDKQLIELLKEKRNALINQAVTKGLDPNAKMKNSGVIWIGEIPEDWEVVPLLKLLDSKVDYRGATPEKVDDGIFLVTAKNIKEGKIDYAISQEFVPGDQYFEIMHRGLPQKGDLLFTTEAPLGEVANVENTNIALAQRIIKMAGRKARLDNYYLKYFIMTALFQGHLQSHATGSTALGIKASNMCYLRLIIPPFKDQLQIVQFLDKHTSNIDKTIERIEEKIELLEEYKKSLIHYVITGKIDVRSVAA